MPIYTRNTANNGDKTVIDVSCQIGSISLLTGLIDTNLVIEKDKHIIYLPTLDSKFKIHIDLNINGVPINRVNTPNLTDALFQMIQRSKIWEKLGYTSGVLLEDMNSFVVVLMENLFDLNMFNDLMISPLEQYELNDAHLNIVENICIQVNIQNLELKNYWHTDCIKRDLNFALFNQFIDLEKKYPLIFNYETRMKYKNLESTIPFLVKSCLKSKETFIIEQRAIIIGILKNLNDNAKDYMNHVQSLRLLQSQNLHDAFKITWFA